MAQDHDPFKVSSPRIYLLRMVIFLILCALIVVVIHQQIWTAFKANPPLNALIIGVLLIGILLSFRQVIRLFPEVAWVNEFRLADPGITVARPPVLLGADGRHSARPHRPHDDLVADHAQHSGFDRDPARRGARDFALHDGPAHLPRPARHVLGPDRDGRLGRQGAGGPAGRRRRQLGVRHAQGRPRRAA